ncbi:MAG: hypothetical protein ABIP30_07710 [Ferruginibacter sp.]
MNTKYLMIASSIFMALLGLSATFLPGEILDYVGLNSTVLPTLLIQITGALYLGFAILNFMAKTVLIGGIYAKPLCLGNFLHFTVAGLALAKAAVNHLDMKIILIAAILYSIFAILFALVSFTTPAKK